MAVDNANGIYSADYSAIVPTLHGGIDAGTLAEFREKKAAEEKEK